MSLNNIDAAVESYQKALELEPNDGKEILFLWNNTFCFSVLLDNF